MDGWKTQLASDVIRDGLGIELLNSDDEVVAEIFRRDKDNSVFLNTFNNEVPLPVIEWAINVAREQLSTFEDGSRLPPRPI